jgi:hypothetical protein
MAKGYTKEQRKAFQDEICEKICEGWSVNQILKQKHMCSYPTYLDMLRDDKDFLENYTRARESSADYYSHRIIDIADQLTNGNNPTLEPSAARVAIDAYKWTAGKMKPKKYGDIHKFEHTGKDGKDLNTVAVLNINVTKDEKEE